MADKGMTETLNDNQFMQYYRQILLSQVSEYGQQKLLNQHVIVVGVGGLGCHVTQQLTAAGIGHIYLLDDDLVELSNLPRQILFDVTSIGKPKAICAAEKVIAMNSDTQVRYFCKKFTYSFAEELLHTNAELQQAHQNGQLILLDCTDNMPTRQLINAWCATHFIPLISASVAAFSGQLLVIDGQVAPQSGCYHCLFGSNANPQGCANLGVLGPTVATMASMQALTTIKHILRLDTELKYLHIFDGLQLSWRQFVRHRDPKCKSCGHWPSQSENQLSSAHQISPKKVNL
ncbi:HesA/MoeB/ThiF family protein [Aliiglaciecola sp. 3_MG-2023]|uniref:HesA/MoeB/ThiF family protein n=1 Tax=Aliiglaciecola sp. 3_MG-2023 TaxID=3062644 RepID=UPI0026E35C09|nr:HesA/MoeB/ThiF family protein [Aliiglaciecola sp. 3_MG-2023]MDO6694939.1 HesA/MoeB/ThiF family protein [Aliiglaciecola sp. 3_MG-2023]